MNFNVKWLINKTMFYDLTDATQFSNLEHIPQEILSVNSKI